MTKPPYRKLPALALRDIRQIASAAARIKARDYGNTPADGRMNAIGARILNLAEEMEDLYHTTAHTPPKSARTATHVSEHPAP